MRKFHCLVLSAFAWSYTTSDRLVAQSLIDAGKTIIERTVAGWAPVGVWSGGALLTIEGYRSEAPRIRAFGIDGKQLAEAVVNVPGAGIVVISDGCFARGADGTIVACGVAYTSDSRGGNFIARFAPSGARTLMRVSPYAPYGITVASDGAIWTVGRELVDGREGSPQHMIVRKFDREGNQLSALVPRSTMKAFGVSHPVVKSYIASSSDRVGWYSHSARQYIEFDLDGREVGRYKGAEHGPDRILSGFAISEDRNVYLSVLQDRTGTKGWEILRLDRGENRWAPVLRTSSSVNGKGGILFGSEGNNLVISERLPVVHWLRVSE